MEASPNNQNTLTDMTKNGAENLGQRAEVTMDELDERMQEHAHEAQHRMRHLGERATHFAEEHHINEIPQKTKNALSSPRAKAALIAGGLAVMGFVGKKIRSARQQSQQSLSQRFTSRMPFAH